MNAITKKQEVEASASEREFGLKLTIDANVYQKIMHWVNKSDFEVSGLGSVIFDQENNVLRVVDAIILPQKNTGTTTDIKPEHVNKAMFEHHRSRAPGQLKFWWHSHVNMGVFWSGTDIDTIKKLGGEGWYCATVFNKKREVKSAFCQGSPVRLLVSDIPTEIVTNAELTKQWDEEYDKNVENVKHTYVVGSGGNSSLFTDDDLKEYLRQLRKENEQEAKAKDSQDDEKSEKKQTKTVIIAGEEYEMEVYPHRKKNLVPVQKKTYAGISENGQLNLPDLTPQDIKEAAELGEKTFSEWEKEWDTKPAKLENEEVDDEEFNKEFNRKWFWRD